MADLNSKMKTIQALLDRADHPNTPTAEADSCRAKAETLMRKYRIEEAQLAASAEGVRSTFTPVKRDIVVCPAGAAYYNTYWSIAYHTLNHCGVRFTHRWGNNDEGVFSLIATVVGFESDVRYAEMLMTNARLLFAERMEPKRHADMTDEDNVYRMRNAGMERWRISELMGWGGNEGSGPLKVTRVYKRACQQKGVDPKTLTGKGNSMKVYREEYVKGFVSGYYNLLWRARNAADTGGGELVLANRKEMVDDAFYDAFPELRPKAEVGNNGEGRVKHTQRKAREYKATKADMKRWERANSAAGRAGANAGKRAAEEVKVNKATKPGAING